MISKRTPKLGFPSRWFDMFIVDNPLNQFNTYTYNFKLFQIHPVNLKQFKSSLSTNQTILIADNSQTLQFNISSVVQRNVLGYSQARYSFQNSFTITIDEPNSVNFLENLVLSANELGIENHLHAKYILMLQFLGRDENNIAKNIPQTFIYPLIIYNIQTNITSSGGSYILSCIENGTAGYNYIENVIKSQVTIEASTVGEFVVELEKKLNEAEENINLTNINSIYPNEYQISFDDTTQAWAKWKIEQSENILNVIGISKVKDKLQFVIPHGTNITDVFNIVLASTKEYKQIQTTDNSTMKEAGADKPTTEKLNKLPVFFKIISDVEYMQYDYLRNDYIERLKFKIKKHIAPTTILDSISYNNSIADKNTQTSRLDNLIKNNILRKKYDYIYTGTNTEVIDIKLDFDYAYFNISVIGGGQFGDSNYSKGNVGNDIYNIAQKIIEHKKKIAQYNNQIENIKRNNPKYISNPSSNKNIINIKRNQNIEKTQLEKTIADLHSQTTNNTQQYNISTVPQTLRENNISLHPARFVSDIIDKGNTYGPENSLDGASLKFGEVKSNLENSADLITIELHIKGDPYWLGRPNSFYNLNSDTNIADYEKGGIMFVLNAVFPPGFDNTGQIKPRDDFLISGIYLVFEVENTYTNGQFTQMLYATKDLITNYAIVKDSIKEKNTISHNINDNFSNANKPNNISPQINDPATKQEILSTF